MDKNHHNPPAISVVVIGRNEGDRLLRCLESVRKLDYPQDRLEVIYVDTASTDDSPTRAEPLADRVVRIDPERPSAAAARNAGWRAAQHELVQFFDGDTVVHPQWLRRAVDAISAPDRICVFGRVEEAQPKRSVLHYWTHRDWHIPYGPTTVCGGVAMFRADALQTLNGFDERLIAGEEPDLCFRALRANLGSIHSLNIPMVTHDIGDFAYRQYWRRCVRTGHAYAEVAARHAGSGRRFWLRENLRMPAPLLLLAAAVVASIALRTLWPAAAWLALQILQYARFVVAELRTGCPPRWALLGALRYFAAKPPQALGQALFVFRTLTGKGQGRLIEYKRLAAEPDRA
jgi:glycosyltransferase involved in cell wall biosynthesis